LRLRGHLRRGGYLQYDGRVGIGTAPQATLDVAGTVYLRGAPGQIGLTVAANGAVGVGTAVPTVELDVLGTVLADAFIHPVETRYLPMLPATHCRGGDDFNFEPNGGATFVSMTCAVTLPAGVTVTGLACVGSGETDVLLTQRDADFITVAYDWALSGDLSEFLEITDSPGPVLEDGGSLLLTADTLAASSTLSGCRVSYEVDRRL
jgi:hypothetical protein